MPFTSLPLDSPYRKRISLSAMITCAKVQFALGVLLIVFQIPASAFTYYESWEQNQTTNNVEFQPLSLFFLDCWFPGILMGILGIFCAGFQLRKFKEAVAQVKNLQEEGESTGERPKWAGLISPRGKSLTLLFFSTIPTYGLLLTNGLSFGLANRLHQDNPEVPYEKTTFLIFFHVAIFVCSVPTFILVITGMSSLTIVSGNCCLWAYPYPVFLDFSENSSLVGLYGPKFKSIEERSNVADFPKN